MRRSVSAQSSDPPKYCMYFLILFSLKDPDDIPMTYFAIFDGHAGTGASLMAVNTLHYQILEKLDLVYELLVNSTLEQRQFSRKGDLRPYKWPFLEKEVSVESLVTGALEATFC